MQRLDVPPPLAGTPGPLSRPTPAAIGGLLEGGGFSKVAVEQAEVTFEFDSAEQHDVEHQRMPHERDVALDAEEFHGDRL